MADTDIEIKVTGDLGMPTDAAKKIVVAAQQPLSRGNRVIMIKAELWSRYSWSVMLMAAPSALQLLGYCRAMATDKEADGIELVPPSKGFQFLRGYKFLGSALVELVNTGRTAFERADSNMKDIAAIAEMTKQNVALIYSYLKDHDAEPELYETELNQLKSSSEKCHKKAIEMHEAFNHWLNYVMELHAACQEASGFTEVKFKTHEDQKAAMQQMKIEREKQEAAAQKVMDEFATTLKEQNSKYKELNDNYPTGSSLMKQQMAMMAAETVQNLVTIGATAAACYYSPASGIAFGAQALSKVGKDGDKSDSKDDKKDETPKKDSLNSVLGDPVLIRCTGVKTNVANIQKLLSSSSSGGPDWDYLARTARGNSEPKEKPEEQTRDKTDEKPNGTAKKDEKPAEKEKSETTNGATEKEDEPAEKGKDVKPSEKDSEDIKTEPTPAPKEEKKEKEEEFKDDDKLPIGSIIFMLEAEEKDISKRASEKSSENGKKMVQVLTETIKVAKEVEQEALKGKKLTTWTKLKDESDTVMGWKKTLSDSMNTMLELAAAAAAQPGGTTGSPTFLINPADPHAKEKIQGRTDLNKTTLAAHQSQLEIYQKGLMATQKIYLESSVRVQNVKEKLAKLNAEMEELKSKTNTLERVRKVLHNCIALLIDLKAKVTELVRFFSTMTRLVDQGVSGAVEPYSNHIRTVIKKATSHSMISNSLLNTINQYTIMIAAFFALYIDVGQMYTKVHFSHIAEGLTLIDEIGMPGGGGTTIEEKKRKLDTYSSRASKGIETIVEEAGNKVMQGVNDRLKFFDSVLAVAPALPDAAQQAIMQGAASAEKEMERELYTKNPGMDFLSLSQTEKDKEAPKLAKILEAEDAY